MISSPDVTVVIPTIYERRELLGRALDSVLNQTLAPTEIIIIDDHLREGAATTRNKALAQVKTRWVAWLDDDDELLPTHIQSLVKGIRRARAQLAYSYAQFVGGRDPLATSVNGHLVSPFGVPFGVEQRRHLRELGNFIPVTWLGETELIRKVGGFPQPNSFPAVASGDCEDYGLLLRLLDAGAEFVHVPEVTWRYHFHGANLGGRGGTAS